MKYKIVDSTGKRYLNVVAEIETIKQGDIFNYGGLKFNISSVDKAGDVIIIASSNYILRLRRI